MYHTFLCILFCTVYSARMQMASILTVLSTVCFVLLLVVPSRESSTNTSRPPANQTFHNLSSAVPQTTAAAVGSTTAAPTELPPRHSWGLTNIQIDSTFLWLILVRTLAFTFLNPVFNLSDAMVYAMFARVLRAQASERVVVRSHRSGSGSGAASGPPSPGLGTGDGGSLPSTMFASERPSLTELEISSQWVAEEPEDPGARIASGYGLARGVGSLGWLGINALAAIVLPLILPGRDITDTFPYMLMTLVVTHAAAATNFIFFSPGRIKYNFNYMRHVGIVLRNREVIKTYIMATLQGMLHAQFETYIYWYHCSTVLYIH